MPRKKETPTLRLKNESEVDADSAYVRWQRLEQCSPAELKALADLANGEDGKVTVRMRAALMTACPSWFTDNGSLVPLTKNVIQSAVRDSAEGTVVVTPFVTANQEEVNLLNKIHRKYSRLEAKLAKQMAKEFGAGGEWGFLGVDLGRALRRVAKDAKDSDDPGYSRRG
jgi:hypothetical protein